VSDFFSSASQQRIIPVMTYIIDKEEKETPCVRTEAKRIVMVYGIPSSN